MRLLELTLPTPEDNLALDEALLAAAEAGEPPGEVLRLWESDRWMVVVGRGSRIADEVDVTYCRRHVIPVLRRVSGGAAIVTGPGCLMYALVLAYKRHPGIRSIPGAHAYVLDRMGTSLSSLGTPVRRAGLSDLVLADSAGSDRSSRNWKKISGNSMRCGRKCMLYHGTVLYDFDLARIGECLRMPSRMPRYRGERSHGEFVANYPAGRSAIRAAVAAGWGPTAAADNWPRDRTDQLAAEKYGRAMWNEAR